MIHTVVVSDSSDLPNHSTVVLVALPANRSALSFPLASAWPEYFLDVQVCNGIVPIGAAPSRFDISSHVYGMHL